MQKIHAIIVAGYTPMPDSLRDKELSIMRKIWGEDFLLGVDKALIEKNGMPQVYYPLKAAMDAEKIDSITVVGSIGLESILPILLDQIKSEPGIGKIEKSVYFHRMHYPDLNEFENASYSRRMQLEAKCIYNNLSNGFAEAPEGSYVMAIPCDLPEITGSTVDKIVMQCKPYDKGIYFPLIAKERLGRLRRHYLSLINDKWPSHIYKKDKYGRMNIKESNCLFFSSQISDYTLQTIASIYSIRKLKDMRSFVHAIDIFGSDVPKGDIGLFDSIARKMLGLSRLLPLVLKYGNSSLKMTDLEKTGESLFHTSFSFFEMNWSEWSRDNDSHQDISGKHESLKADLVDVSLNPSKYKGLDILLEGVPQNVQYSASPLIHKKEGLESYLLSLLGYKEISLNLVYEGHSVRFYRNKNMNPLTHIASMIKDRFVGYNNDIELLFGLEKKISEVISLPQMKYERIYRDLSYAEKMDESACISGVLDNRGIRVNELIVGNRKYYFRHHCPDPKTKQGQD